MAAAALRTYLDFQRQIAGYRDPTLRRATAVTRLETERTPPEELRELGPLIVFLPTELDPVDTRLLHAAARWVPVVTASAQVPDATASGSDRAELRVIRALDPTEEVRQVLREIVADLEREVALHRTAILYRQVDPYSRLLRESLAAAELPWFGLGGKRLADSQPARLLLGVLDLPERAFAREAVLGWLDAQPAIDSDIPPFAWDRLSRAADIVRGADQWQARLLAFADQQAAEADRRPGESTTSLRNFLEQQANLARRMAAVIEQLASSLRAPPDGSPWTAFVEWAEGVRTQLATPRGGWPADHHAEAEAVRLRLAQLTRADQFDTGGVTLETFVAALDAALQSRSLPEGRLGNGVVIGPIESAAGLTFDRVYIVGLTEGAFPPTLVADPFFRGGHPLDRRPRRREAERAAFLAAIAGADGGRLTVSAPDSVGGRAAFASHWLLELAQHEWRPSGGQLDAAAFRRLNETEAPWLRIVDSPRDGIQRSPAADLEDYRLGAAAAWQARASLCPNIPLLPERTSRLERDCDSPPRVGVTHSPPTTATCQHSPAPPADYCG